MMQLATAQERPALTLADLEAFDPTAPPPKGRERRFFCPVCADDSDRRKWWRCLCVNLDTGAFLCHRPVCGAHGVLREKWAPLPPRERRRAELRRATALPPLAEEPDAEKLAGLHERMKRERPVPLAGTPGADYLAGRGVPPELAHKAGVRFAPRWFGRPAVLFPLRNEAGELLAVNGRHTDGQAHTTDTPKTHTLGPSGQAVFAWPGALDANPAVLVEGPMCVLSLALVGVPAVAPVGTTAPRWLLRRWAFRRVFVAFDSDPETHTGDTAAAKLLAELAEFGAQGERLRPVGAKDWNDILQAGGVEALRAALAPVLAAVPAGEPLDRCPCGAEVFAFTLEGMPYCEAHAPALFAPNTAAPGTSVRCPACWRILPRGHERCPGACELREVTSCAGLPAAGPAAPFDAPAGADYEPGQDWPAEEDAPARVPGLVYLPGEEPAWCARCAVELVNLRAPDGLCGPCRWQGTKRHRVATLPPTRNPHGIQ